MPTVTLTARSVAALKAAAGEAQTEYWDDLLPGFALRVGAGGSKTYLVRYRANGKHRRLKLGRHPELSLAKAREKAREQLAGAQAGEDPAQERQQRRSADATFRALATEVLEVKARSTREKTRAERKRILDADLLPAWGTRPAGSITRREVKQLVERIAARAPVMGNRTLALVKVIFNEGLEREFPGLEANPAHRVRPPAAEGARGRFLSREELRTVWDATAPESPVMRALLRFALLTAQRIGSVRSMRWSDIDNADTWHIPAAAFKGKRPHLVPLSREARAVLKELKPLTGSGEYVFPGRPGGRAPYVNSTNSAQRRVRERAELAPWTVHDFRTTFRTHATRAAKPGNRRDPAGLGVAPNVADAVLGHKEASLGFDRYTAEPERYLLSEKRDALAQWGAFVLQAARARNMDKRPPRV